MRSWRCAFIVGLLMGPAALLASGQNMGGSVHVGTLGLGGRITRSIGDGINVRAGIDVVPLTLSTVEEDVEFEVKFPSPSVTAVLDLHPGGSGFRLSAGAVYFGRDLGIEGVPTEPVEFGDHEYTPAELGTIRGSLGTSSFAPYAGLGWGNAIGPGFGFALDLGVAFHGTPDFSYEATGSASSDPQLQGDLREEAETVNEDLPGAASLYPIINLGFGFQFD